MGLFKKNIDEEGNFDLFFDWIIAEKTKQIHIKKMALEHAIDMISRTISKCEIKFYQYDSKQKKVIECKNSDTYYKLNIKPNENEVATSFFYMVCCSLLRDNKALLVIENEQLYFADSWEENDKILFSKEYSSIRLKNTHGDTLTLKKHLQEKDVINLKLGNSKIKNSIDNYFTEYSKLLSVSASNYKSHNINKWRLKFPGGQPTMKDPDTKQDISYEEYKKKIVNGLFSEEEALILLSEQFGLEKIGSDKELSSQDYRDMIKKWSDDVAMAFNIPLDVFYGSKTDKSTGTNDFITLAVDPIIQVIQDNFNAKLISKEEFIKGNKFIINKLNIKHFDIFDVAGPIDKLSANGFSNNENREFLGIPTVDESWANEHRFTKNYSELRGGDDNE